MLIVQHLDIYSNICYDFLKEKVTKGRNAMRAYFEKNEHRKIYYAYQKNDDCDIHFHQNVEIIHLISGSLEMSVRGETKRLFPGDTAIASSYETHGFHTVGTSEFKVYIFPAKMISDYISRTENHMLKTPFLEKCARTDELIELVDRLMLYRHKENSLMAIGFAYAILGIFVEELGLVEKPKSSQTDTLLAKMLTYINNHFREDITLADLANQLGYHKSYLSNIFNKGVGYHFNRYVNLLRVRYARQLIINTAMTLNEISVQAGFQCTRSFRRAFIEYYELPPHEYKKTHKKTKQE